MNKAIIMGNLVRVPEIKYTQNDKAVANFTVAVNEGHGDKQKTTYINCVAWEKTAEAIGNYLDKGSKVLVDGKIQVRNYENQEGKKVYVTEVLVKEIEFLSKKKDSMPVIPGQEDAAVAFGGTDVDETIPF